MRGQRNQRSIPNAHRITKRESPIDTDEDDEGINIEDEINEADEEEGERYILH